VKKALLKLIVGILGCFAVWAQPAMTSTNIPIDIDGNGSGDFLYTIGASGPFGDFPATWLVGSGLDVLGFARFLRGSSEGVFFEQGERVDSSRKSIRTLPPAASFSASP
jgi:hypothetical protein